MDLSMRALIAEDNEKLAGYLKEAFVHAGFDTDIAHNGNAAEELGKTRAYDLVVLDLMMPGKGGVAVCRALRDSGVGVPIIMATAKGETDERIEGLDSGADDYLVKPYAIEELMARARALMRRPRAIEGEILKVGDLELNWSARRLTLAGREILLSPRELAIMERLMRRKGIVLSREDLLAGSFDDAHESFSNVIDVHIRQIRKKLGSAGEKYIETVRGAGYRLLI
jgi:DNA-binding response OmpR family regulator